MTNAHNSAQVDVTTNNPPVCGYCHHDAVLTTGAELYPRRPNLATKQFWHCAPCEAWVGCHPASQDSFDPASAVPLGSLANAELRRWRSTAHQLFDELWQSKTMTRQQAYAWLGRTLRLPPSECHVGAFDVSQCKALVEALAALG